jgi:hypothetical protein
MHLTERTEIKYTPHSWIIGTGVVSSLNITYHIEVGV